MKASFSHTEGVTSYDQLPPEAIRVRPTIFNGHVSAGASPGRSSAVMIIDAEISLYEP